MKQSATNRLVNEVSKVKTSHVYYNRLVVVRFPSQVIHELNSQTSTRLNSLPFAFCLEGTNRKILAGEHPSDPTYCLITSLQYWHRGWNRNAEWHSTSPLRCTSPYVAHSPWWSHQGCPHTHEPKQPENQAITALPACCAKWTSE